MLNVVKIQVILVLVGAAIAYFNQGESAIIPALYGGMVAVVNTLMLGRRMVKARERAATDPQGGVYSMYISAVVRFVFVLVALGVGVGFIFGSAAAIPLLGTFIVTQLGYMFVVAAQRAGAGKQG